MLYQLGTTAWRRGAWTGLAIAAWLFGVVSVVPLAQAGRSGLSVKTIRSVPRTEEELAEAHEQSEEFACEAVEAGEPQEIRSFLPFLSRRAGTPGELPVPSSRRHAFSVGLDMLERDQDALPKLSRSQILNYISQHYVSVQAHVQRDLVEGDLYLHHLPFAINCEFNGPRLTQGFNSTVSEAVQNMRSLGLLVKSRSQSDAASLRTLVLLYKNTFIDLSQSTNTLRGKTMYEYIVMRAIPGANRDDIDIHTFVTSDGRTRWNYLVPFEKPTQPSECGLLATILFTEYKYASLFPAAPATRRIGYHARSAYTTDELDAYCQTAGLTGDALDNLTEVLDAVIAGKVGK